MSKAGTDDDTCRHVEEHVVRPLGRTILMLVHPFVHFPADIQADSPAQSVPAHLQITQVQQHRINSPSDKI